MPRDYHTKQSKSEGGRQIPHDIAYAWNLKNDTNLSKKQTHKEKTCVCQGAGGKERNELGVWD